ncbi:MAG: hypothetical protein LAO06_03880 [Acidobacteriia bacterium]|nr:hypothetical protein [Terriglobia bacterium]
MFDGSNLLRLMRLADGHMMSSVATWPGIPPTLRRLARSFAASADSYAGFNQLYEQAARQCSENRTKASFPP